MRKIRYYENCQANFQKKKEICRKEIQPLEFKLLNIVVGGLVAKLCLFATPRTIACQALLSMGFSRQEYWSRLPFPSPKEIESLEFNNY